MGAANSQIEIKKRGEVEWIYDTNNVMGKGAFGNVYKGTNASKNLVVAIKVVGLVRGTDAGRDDRTNRMVELVEREIGVWKLLSQSKHDNIVSVFDVLYVGHTVYYAMEFCPLGDLHTYLNSLGPMDERTLRIFLRQISDALMFMHEQDIIHRDLKPANILLRSDLGSKLRYPPIEELIFKISDFGFSRVMGLNEISVNCYGTNFYAAPEIIMKKSHGPNADLWSMGVIVHECLTNSRGTIVKELSSMNYLSNRQSPPPDSYRPTIPEGISDDLCDLLIHLLKIDPKKRMTFEDFYSHLFIRPHPTGGRNMEEKVESFATTAQQIVRSIEKLRVNNFII